MTNEQEKARELAKLLNAFADGKQLQYKTDLFVWYDSNNIDYIIDSFISGRGVRIKPETKQIALTQQDLIDRELSGKTISLLWSKTGTVYHISKYDKYHIIYDSESLMTYETLKQECTFLDNSPCYKEVECE